MSWHGKDYDTTLRDRTDDVKEFLDFVSTLRSNNLQIPILVGGDFNMDMKSYDMSDYKDLSIVPYRPLSGKNVMLFSYGSGCAASMLLAHVKPGYKFSKLKVNGNFQDRLA